MGVFCSPEDAARPPWLVLLAPVPVGALLCVALFRALGVQPGEKGLPQ